ncbi:solute carrier family 66 member 2 isoform X1 [Culicoides brevitarsis]|uniref:solute carrier family 66 member 2 isoform X1 n=1 Tax=Culicoides brevitarsis TaxID=469753 RepID=UPI00307C56B2
MDWVIHDELGITVGTVVGWMAASAMVLGGVLPYVPQYRQIKQTQDADGFSLYVCLSLLMANTLRIFFWFSKRYELPLVVQSIVMNITMFLMIHLCVRVKRSNAILEAKERVFSGDERATLDSKENEVMGLPSQKLKKAHSRHHLSDFDASYFWAWTDFQSYLDFMLVVWAIGAAVTYLMLPFVWFMEIVGFMAVFIEAMLGAPQFLKNFRTKSTQGMSIQMVLMWLIGDMFKTVYFIVRDAPTQFWLCGSLQVSLDIAILCQVWMYRNNVPRQGHGD